MWLCWLPVLMEALISVSQHCGAGHRRELFLFFCHSSMFTYRSDKNCWAFPLNKSKSAIKQLCANKTDKSNSPVVACF